MPKLLKLDWELTDGDGNAVDGVDDFPMTSSIRSWIFSARNKRSGHPISVRARSVIIRVTPESLRQNCFKPSDGESHIRLQVSNVTLGFGPSKEYASSMSRSSSLSKVSLKILQ